MLKLGEIDFGPTDARHIIFSSPRDQDIFTKVFLKPANLDIDKFFDGRKSIVYGIKGSGKSAWLKFLEINLRKTSRTKFYYFRKETDRFFDDIRPESHSEESIQNTEALTKTEVRDFWRLFVSLAVCNILHDDTSPQARSFIGLVRRYLLKEEGWISSITRRVPVIQTFVAKLKAEPELEVSGTFHTRGIEHIDDELLFSLLGERENKKPIYLFFDEMEVVFTSTERFSAEVTLISALIECIRDMNEVFRRTNANIFLITAIRKEISDNIIGGDTSKIVNDLGQEILWNRRSWSVAKPDFIHPLFEIIIRRIAFSEDNQRSDVSDTVKRTILEQRFPRFIKSGNIQKDILDLTMYRPRDCALLMGICGSIDKDRQSFRKETFQLDYRQQFGNRVWIDIQEALASKYSKAIIKAMRQLLSVLDGKFTTQEFFQSIDDSSYDPDVSVLADLDPKQCIGILKDMFELGAIGNLSSDKKVRFRFRGQSSLDTRQNQVLLIHQSLLSALS